MGEIFFAWIDEEQNFIIGRNGKFWEWAARMGQGCCLVKKLYSLYNCLIRRALCRQRAYELLIIIFELSLKI